MKTSTLKNVSRTSGQPGLVRISAARPPEHDDGRDGRDRLAAAGAGAAPRPPAPLGGGLARAHAAGSQRSAVRRSGGRELLEHRGVGRLAHPLLLDLPAARRARSARRSPPRRSAVSGESFSSRAPHWSPPGAANWPTVVASGTCDGGQVEGRRHVDDDRVDLAVLERADDVVGGVEDLRVVGRLDHVVDRVEAGGPDLDADRWRPARSASEVAFAASESLSATTAWLAS